jgi:uncharacterized phage infection (PIP) family protein YhgE
MTSPSRGMNTVANDELAGLKRNLDGAQSAYTEAHKALASANRAATDARNALNTAQKQFDAYIAKLRSEAPMDSDWQLERRRGIAVAEVSA